MRDPQRIRRILNKLETIWESSPDLRLGQLISTLKPVNGMTFYAEDEVMEERMDAWIKERELDKRWKS